VSHGWGGQLGGAGAAFWMHLGDVIFGVRGWRSGMDKGTQLQQQPWVIVIEPTLLVDKAAWDKPPRWQGGGVSMMLPWLLVT